MLKKNVYLLYPPGYGGSYINWAISASDNDLKLSTVSNPINRSASQSFGGVGTSHLHHRIPTHQGLMQHLVWVLYNQPVDRRIYIINTMAGCSIECISTISRYDPTGVFIHIHDANSPDVASYGAINCVTKWPTYLDVVVNCYDVCAGLRDHKNFDPYHCSNDRVFRNLVVDRQWRLLPSFPPIVQQELDAALEVENTWYTVRNRVQPHEVNEQGYISQPDLTNRIFQLSCKDIPSTNFPVWLKEFLEISGVSSAWNTDQVCEVHQDYIDAQTNLQWFESIKKWENTGRLDQYLTSHSIIESQVIQRILEEKKFVVLTQEDKDRCKDRWTKFYSQCAGPDWPEYGIEGEHRFYDLPTWVQQEIRMFGYELMHETIDCDIIDFDWKNMSLEQINDIYQKHK